MVQPIQAKITRTAATAKKAVNCNTTIANAYTSHP